MRVVSINRQAEVRKRREEKRREAKRREEKRRGEGRSFLVDREFAAFLLSRVDLGSFDCSPFFSCLCCCSQ
jgi:hypothetical protein